MQNSANNNVVQLDLFRDNYAKVQASRALVDIINEWADRGKVSKADAKRFSQVMLSGFKFGNQP